MFEIDTQTIRKMIFAKKFSASKLAEKAGLTKKTIAKILKGGARANTLTVGKLADALDVDGEKLISKQKEI